MLFAECDSFCALQACFEGVQIETVSEIDIFVSSKSTITLDHMKKLKNNTFVGNTRHFDNEIDLAGSECLEGFSSSPLVTGCFCWLQADKNDVYLFPRT